MHHDANRHLHIDPFSGIAGDMFLAAALDLGAPLEDICHALQHAGVDEPFTVETTRVLRQGIGGTALRILDQHRQPVDHDHAWAHEHEHEHEHEHAHHHDHDHSHTHEHEHEHEHDHAHEHTRADHEHDHPHTQAHAHSHTHPHSHDKKHTHTHEHTHSHSHSHEHRHHHHAHAHVGRQALLHIASHLPLTGVRCAWAVAVVDALAAAEATVHGKGIDEVHFHEVGGLDSIVDLLGSVVALEHLGITSVSCGPLPVSRGFVRCAHGRMPVPAPATAYLLQGRAVFGVDRVGELVTPTGAALVAGLLSTTESASGALVPPMTLLKIGHGAGQRDPADAPNILRLWMGTPNAPASHTSPVTSDHAHPAHTH